MDIIAEMRQICDAIDDQYAPVIRLLWSRDDGRVGDPKKDIIIMDMTADGGFETQRKTLADVTERNRVKLTAFRKACPATHIPVAVCLRDGVGFGYLLQLKAA